MSLMTIFLFSCSKEHETYPKTYSSDSVTEGHIRLFTANGEVKDKSLIDDFMNRHCNAFISADTFAVEGDINVTYLSDHDINISSPAGQENGRAYTMNNLIYWEHPDTLRTFYLSPLYKYKPLYVDEVAVASSTGFNSIFLYKECLFVQRHQGNLRLPMVNRLHKLSDNPIWDNSITSERVNNVFDYEYIYSADYSIGINDTIMVQEFFINIAAN